jgi:hypothetical protein
MAGRTVSKHTRVYVGGYDLSGHSRSIGPLAETYAEDEGTAMSDAIVGVLNGQATVSVGTLNGIFDNTATTGLHTLHAAGPGSRHVVTVALGDRAAPTIGDVCYAGHFEQGHYLADLSGGMVFATLPFARTSIAATTLAYAKPWGVLLNANSARTAANAGTGVDNATAGETTHGGFLAYHITAGDGTATISIDDSEDNSSFTALSGATTGELDTTTVQAGIVALGRTDTVRRYLRWQVSLNTATTVTFVLSFHRAMF